MLAGFAIVLLALNLRVGISSVGVVLTALQDDLDMSNPVAGLLATLPVICFAVIGLSAGGLIRRVGIHRAAAALLTLMVVGLVVRALAPSVVVFVGGTFVLLAGVAVGNVLLPALAKFHFPDRIALISSLYGAAVIGGSSLGALGSGVLADGSGSWRPALGAWSVLALIALTPWLFLLRQDRAVEVSAGSITFARLLRSRPAWLMVLCFGALSAQAYAQLGWYPAILIDAGMSTARAGAMFSVLTAVGIPTMLALPWLTRRLGSGALLPILFGLCTAAGWVGVLLAPDQITWLWSVLIGFGAGIFAWALAMIGRHTRTAEGAAALSGFAQGFGFLLASIGPFGVGLLHDATHSWNASILLLVGIGLGICVIGARVSRPWTLEDTLIRRGALTKHA